ncbi:MAG: cytidylate kinase-like family protein [Verrucomicrobia bacterium]|nr:cytidylate kinase-like family protein [Verrucomicrobiota bacterium]
MKPEAVEKCWSYIQCHLQRPKSPRRSAERRLAITISRQTGSGAQAVAEKLAQILQEERLGSKGCPWTVFDRDLIEKVLEDHRLPRRLAELFPEDHAPLIRSMVNEVLGLCPSEWTLFEHTVETILRLADLGNVIIIGRGANLITAHMGHVFHVRLVGSPEVRLRRVQERLGLDEKAARELMEREDKGRTRYLKEHFGADINDPLLYHLVFNTDRIGLEEAARLIAEAVFHGWGGQSPAREGPEELAESAPGMAQ